MKNLLLIILLTFIFCENIFSQQTIWLLNSRKISPETFTMDSINRKLEYLNHKNKEKVIYFDHIFSISDSLGYEKVFFKPQKIDTIFFSVENMRSYLSGQYNADCFYRTRLASFSGFVVGGFFGYILYNPLYAVVPAAGYTALLGLTKPNRDNIVKKYPEYANDEFFMMGYQEAATGKRSFNAAKMSIVGIISGVVAAVIVFNL